MEPKDLWALLEPGARAPIQDQHNWPELYALHASMAISMKRFADETAEQTSAIREMKHVRQQNRMMDLFWWRR